MIDVIVSKIEFKQLFMSEQQFSNIHGSISLNSVSIEIQVLQQLTFLERLPNELSTVYSNAVPLQIKSKQSFSSFDQSTQGFSSSVWNVIVSKINIFNVNCIWNEYIRYDPNVLICDSTVKVLLRVAMNDDINWLILLLCVLKILYKWMMRLNVKLLTSFNILL